MSESSIDLPEDADTGMIRSRVQKVLIENGRSEDAEKFIEETNSLRSDLHATLDVAQRYVTVSGGPRVQAALAGEDAPIGAQDALGDSAWEYKVVKNMTGAGLEETLNRLGRDRWELVSIAGIDGAFTLTGNKIFAVLKRRTSFTGYASLGY